MVGYLLVGKDRIILHDCDPRAGVDDKFLITPFSFYFKAVMVVFVR